MFLNDLIGNCKEAEYARIGDIGGFMVRDHEAIAKNLRDSGVKDFVSVAILCNRLKDELWDDPKYCIQTNEIVVSPVIEKVRRENMHGRGTYVEPDDLIKKYEIKNVAGNNTTNEENRDFLIKLHDEIFEAQDNIEAYKLLERLKEGCRYEYDEEKDKEVKLTKEQWAKRWEEELEEELMPRVLTSCKRVMSMPSPFDWWDSRNSFQQYYLHKKDGILYYAIGGSGSSGQRENMGRWAHVFATLTDTYGFKIPTYCAVYTGCNELELVKKYDTFRVIARELSGNYHADYKEMENLFAGKKIYLKSLENWEYEFSEQED